MRLFPGGDCPPKSAGNRRPVGRIKAENAAGHKEATVNPGALTDALFTGRSITPGAGTDALRRQQALGASFE